MADYVRDVGHRGTPAAGADPRDFMDVERHILAGCIGDNVIVELRSKESTVVAAGVHLRRLPERTFQNRFLCLLTPALSGRRSRPAEAVR